MDSVASSPFLGASYVSRSPNLSLSQLINLYVEVVETKQGKQPGAFYSTPGLLLLTTLTGGRIRGFKTFQGMLYVVAGNTLWRVTPSWVATNLGALLDDGNDVIILTNSSQVAVFSAGTAYVYSANTGFQSIALPFIGAVSGAVYQDGFAVISQAGTFVLWQSNLDDFTTWDPLNFDTADGQADPIIGLGELHRQIFVVKQQHTEIWINAGAQGFVFQRLEGVYMNSGGVAPYSITPVGEAIAWVGQNAEGEGLVHIAEGYSPEKISTYATAYEWQTYPTLADAVGWAYQQSGHVFYVVSFPSANKTWVLDLSASKQLGYPAWHERARFSNGQFSRALYQTGVFFNAMNIVGDIATGAIYALSLQTLTDNGQPRKWLRTWKAHPGSVPGSVRYRQVEIDYQAASQVVGNPQFMLRYTDNGGALWQGPKYAALGQTGQVDQRARFRRLGMERRGLASDRVFELSGVNTTTDACQIALLGANVTMDGG